VREATPLSQSCPSARDTSGKVISLPLLGHKSNIPQIETKDVF